jgi:hypothetical protein
MRLPISIQLCFAFAILFASLEKLEALSLSSRNTECALALSSRVDKAIQATATVWLNSRFHDACALITDTMDDFFSDAAAKEWKEKAKDAIVGFWIDLSPDGVEVTIRAIDLASMLQWAQTHVSVIGLNDRALGNILRNRLDRILDDYPFVGFVEPERFFGWASGNRTLVYAVKRTSVVRHPFLPFLLDVDTKPIADLTGVLVHDEARKKWSLDFDQERPLPNERIWLKSGIEPR